MVRPVKYVHYLLAFLIPPLLFGAALVRLGIHPFGRYAMLVSDLDSQYIQYYHLLYDLLTKQESLFYTWSAGMGLNFISFIAYYLASPLSLLILLFGKAHLPEAIILMVLIKIGLSGLTMSIYLSIAFRLKKLNVLMFAVMYALMGYAVAYSFDIMWLEGIYTLPLILLGTESILRDNRKLLFTVALAYIFITNFYISYMIGIFTFLYFVVRYFSLYEILRVNMRESRVNTGVPRVNMREPRVNTEIPRVNTRESQVNTGVPQVNMRESRVNAGVPRVKLTNSRVTAAPAAWGVFLKRILSFFIGTALAAGLAMFMILPTAMALRLIPKRPTPLLVSPYFQINLLDLYGKLFNGVVDSLRTGTPNIYPGLLATMLFPLFFLSQKIAAKEKILFGMLFAFFIFSFENAQLNLAWHGFDSPNFFPYRNSFLFAFLVMYLAVRAFHVFDRQSVRLLAWTYVANLFLVALLEKVDPHVVTPKVVTINILLLTAYFFLMYGRVAMPWDKKWLNSLLAALVCLDMLANTWLTMKSIHNQFGYNTRRNYVQYSPEIQALVDKTSREDKGFYRMESAVNRNLNDSLRYGYKGITHFSSLSYAGLHRTLNRLGFTTLGSCLWAYYHGSTLITDSMFGIKYLLAGPALHKAGYTQVAHDKHVYLYQNKNALPVGYMLDSARLSAAAANPFEGQNQLFGPDRYFTRVAPQHVSYPNLTVSIKNGQFRAVKKNKSAAAFIEYRFALSGAVQFYTMFAAGALVPSQAEVFVNGRSLGQYPHVYNNRILDLGSYANQPATVSVKLLGDQLTLSQPLFYTLNGPKFEKRAAELRRQSLHVTSWSNTNISGDIYARQGGLLFLSIPYDPGWSVKVDGRAAQLTNINKAFIGVQVGAGKHQVQLNYTPPGFTIGVIISVVSLFILVFLIFRRRRGAF